MDAASSGRLVPTAMTVSPMTNGLTPAICAADLAPHTSISELIINAVKPTKNQIMAVLRGIGLILPSSSAISDGVSSLCFTLIR